MKTAIYIEDGVVQLVLTPESAFEKNAVASFAEKPMSVQVFSGAFYDCRGGWVRMKEHYPELNTYTREQKEDQSIILRIAEPKTENQ